MSRTVAVIDYGSGNLASAARGLQLAAERLGQNFSIEITSDPDAVAHADRIVLPGQGAFADCAAGLAAIDGLRESLRLDHRRYRQTPGRNPAAAAYGLE